MHTRACCTEQDSNSSLICSKVVGEKSLNYLLACKTNLIVGFVGLFFLHLTIIMSIFLVFPTDQALC